MSARELSHGGAIERAEGTMFGVFACDDYDATPMALFRREDDARAWIEGQRLAGELNVDVDVVVVAARLEVWNSVDVPDRDQLLQLLSQDAHGAGAAAEFADVPAATPKAVGGER